MSGLCALSDVKAWLGISNTTSDVRLQLLIDSVSEQMIGYIGYPVRRATYTSERHAINQNQLMYLNAAPIQSVASVTIDGVAISSGANDNNYQFDSVDAKAGRLYIGTGFVGRYFTRNMTYDPVAGARIVLVTYTAGWYLPDDVGYVKGNDTSLPYAISSVCIQEVVGKYRRMMARSEGLSSYKEGGIAWSWASPNNNALSGLNSMGLSDDTCAALNAYKRYGFA